MKILIFWEEFQSYHSARMTVSVELANQLGHELIPVAIRSDLLELPLQDDRSKLGNNVIVLSTDPVHHNMQSIESTRQLLNLLDNKSPEVVIIPGYDSLVNLAALGWCRKNRKGAVLMSDSQQSDYRRSFWKESIKKYLINKYDAAFVAGTSASGYLRQLKMPSERIYTGVDAVDNDFWAKRSQHVHNNLEFWRGKMGLPKKFFLTVCRMIPTKNLIGLLKAYAIFIENKQNPWSLVIVGDGPQREEIEKVIIQLSIGAKVHLLGRLTPDQIAPIYGLASTFVLASSIYETWGLVVNEAMAAGLPVLVSNICGCVPDLVLDGITGYSFDPHNEKQLSTLLSQMSNDDDKLLKMGNNAKKHIQVYSLEHFAKNLFESATTAIFYAKKRK